MSFIHKVGSIVSLKNPLPGEPSGPWKVLGVKLNAAPPVYKLLRETKRAGKPSIISADEGELTQHTPIRSHNIG